MAVAGLREVRDAWRAQPDEWTYMWVELAEQLVTPERVTLLTEDDFAAFDDMAGVLTEFEDAPLEAFEMLVVGARAARGEELQARAALVAMHDRPDTEPAARRRAAVELARRGADGSRPLSIYAEHVRAERGASDPGVVDAVRSALDVHLGSDGASRARAAAYAAELGELAEGLAVAHRARGIQALAGARDRAAAVDALTRAVELDGSDRHARAALAVAWLARGEAARALDVLDAPGADPLRVRPLADAMRWLDEPHRPAPRPQVRCADLLALDLPAYLEDARDGAAGRLELLDGRAAEARRLLCALATRRPDEPRWSYHAAWAELLCDGPDAVSAPRPLRARWPLASLLGTAPEASAALHETGIVAARIALGGGGDAGPIRWEPGALAAEDDLEAIRTIVAAHLRSGDLGAAQEELTSAPFQRLPAADRCHWQGLLALACDRRAEGERALREAVALGSPHAPVALCAHLLEQGLPDPAEQLLAGALARRAGDASVALLDAWIRARNGALEAAERRLDDLLARGDGRAGYALAELGAHRALLAAGAGEHDRAADRWRAASAAALAAERTAGPAGAVPDDVAALRAVLQFAAEPHEQHARRVRPPADDRARRDWVAWHAAVAELWTEAPGPALAAAEDLVRRIEHAGAQPAAAPAIAHKLASIARVAGTRDDAATETAAIALIERLVARTGRPEVAHALQLAAGRGPRASLERLAAARAALVGGDRTGAVALLDGADPDADAAGAACAVLRGALGGPGAPQPAQRAQTGSPALAVLETMAAFAAGDDGAGARRLLGALDDAPELVERTVRLDGLLAALCAVAGSGPAPRALAAAVKRTAERAASPAAATAAARCAAALGATEIALDAWAKAQRLDEVDAELAREHSAYLCHLAVLDARAGDDLAAADRLDLAARVAGAVPA